jgi:hypothetical protein
VTLAIVQGADWGGRTGAPQRGDIWMWLVEPDLTGSDVIFLRPTCQVSRLWMPSTLLYEVTVGPCVEPVLPRTGERPRAATAKDNPSESNRTARSKSRARYGLRRPGWRKSLLPETPRMPPLSNQSTRAGSQDLSERLPIAPSVEGKQRNPVHGVTLLVGELGGFKIFQPAQRSMTTEP